MHAGVHIEDVIDRAIQEINRIADQMPQSAGAQGMVDQGPVGMLPDREAGSQDRQILAQYIRECAHMLAAWAPEASRNFVAIDIWSYPSDTGIPVAPGWLVHGALWETSPNSVGATKSYALEITHGMLPPEKDRSDRQLASYPDCGPQYISQVGAQLYLWPEPTCPGRLFLLISTASLLESLVSGPDFWPQGQTENSGADTQLVYHYRALASENNRFYYYLPEVAIQAMVNYAVYRWLAPLGHRAADTYFKAYNDTAQSFMRLMAEKSTPRTSRRSLYRHV